MASRVSLPSRKGLELDGRPLELPVGDPGKHVAVQLLLCPSGVFGLANQQVHVLPNLRPAPLLEHDQ